MFAEDAFDSLLIEVKELIGSLKTANIHEIWKVWSIDKSSLHYVVLFDEVSHLCTCLTLISHGLICRHFFCIMTSSSQARFHIGLIPSRWYSDKAISNFEKTLAEETAISCVSEKEFGSFEHTITTSSQFEHINQIRSCHVFTKTVQEEMTKKQLWGRGFGMMKHTLNLAITTGRADELYDYHKRLADEMEQEIATDDNTKANNDPLSIARTISNPSKIRTKGRQSKKRFKAFYEKTSKPGKRKHQEVLTDITNACQGNSILLLTDRPIRILTNVKSH